VLLLGARDSTIVRPVVLGFPLARGRVLAMADPVLLRNDVVRRGDPGVLAVRALEWASRGRQAPLVFSEYHFGHGARRGLAGIARDAMLGTAPGRAVLQLVAAALILLLAVAPRPLAPEERSRIERRSPLEHVGALARAYEQIGATQSSARRLVRGLRRRHPAARGHADGEERFLAALRARHPAAADDIAILERALREPLPPSEFREVGGAVERVERTIFPHGVHS
jgi:hypothetical protein